MLKVEGWDGVYYCSKCNGDGRYFNEITKRERKCEQCGGSGYTIPAKPQTMKIGKLKLAFFTP